RAPGGGGGGPQPVGQAQALAGMLDNKLIGSPPEIFTGDRTKTKGFLTQWEIYRGVNVRTQVMSNPYQRAMFFFTYIKGELVDEWVTNAAIWLQQQVFQNSVNLNNEWLWNKIRGGFNRQFTNTLEQEQAWNKLCRGLNMGTNVDEYVTKFE